METEGGTPFDAEARRQEEQGMNEMREGSGDDTRERQRRQEEEEKSHLHIQFLSLVKRESLCSYFSPMARYAPMCNRLTFLMVMLSPSTVSAAGRMV